MGWGPVDWVGRVLPEANLKNKWTLFFEFFALIKHLSGKRRQRHENKALKWTN